jgi:ankyrin repeat protein
MILLLFVSPYQCTPLHLSAMNGRLLILRKLILLLSFSEHTPLHYSAMYGHVEVCRFLLNCNADIEAKDAM